MFKRYLSLGKARRFRHWELVSSKDGVVESGPDPADAPQEEPDVEEEDNAVDAGKGPTSD